MWRCVSLDGGIRVAGCGGFVYCCNDFSFIALLLLLHGLHYFSCRAIKRVAVICDAQ